MTSELDPAISGYISSCLRAPRLTREEELDVARRWRASDDRDAADLLVRGNLRYVVAIALQYRRYGLPLNELVAEGNAGLVHALAGFDPERGTRFITYASYQVRAHILKCVVGSWSLVGVGSGPLRTKMFFKLRRERARIAAVLGEGESATDRLAQVLGMTPAQAQMAVHRLDARDVSLNRGAARDPTMTLMDTLASPLRDPESLFVSTRRHQQMVDIVRRALAILDHRERYIVEKRLMADVENEHSLAAIGRHLGVSRERVRQLESRAKRRLRTCIAEILDERGGDRCVNSPFATTAPAAELVE